MANSVNRIQWESEVDENIKVAENLGTDFPTEDNAGDAVIDPTAGSFEALQAGNAAAVGALKFVDINGLLVYIVTAAPTDRTP